MWKAVKLLDLLFKNVSISNICLKKYEKIRFDEKANANSFKEFFCNLNSDLVAKLPPSSTKFGISSLHSYYQNILDLLPSTSKFSKS